MTMTSRPRPIWEFECEYRYFDMKSGVELRIMSHTTSYLYHATLDGRHPWCGAVGVLEDGIAGAERIDPTRSGMMCEHCAGRIRRVKKEEEREA